MSQPIMVRVGLITNTMMIVLVVRTIFVVGIHLITRLVQQPSLAQLTVVIVIGENAHLLQNISEKPEQQHAQDVAGEAKRHTALQVIVAKLIGFMMNSHTQVV